MAVWAVLMTSTVGLLVGVEGGRAGESLAADSAEVGSNTEMTPFREPSWSRTAQRLSHRNCTCTASRLCASDSEPGKPTSGQREPRDFWGVGNLKSCLLGEGFVTVGAREWSLAGVGAHVSLEDGCVGEGLAAEAEMRGLGFDGNG